MKLHKSPIFQKKYVRNGDKSLIIFLIGIILLLNVNYGMGMWTTGGATLFLFGAMLNDALFEVE